MPLLLEQCQKYFKSKNFYDVLEINEKATEKEVKKAYHKLSLRVHPDRVSEDEKLEATEKFKVLGKIHSILSDKDKRAVYDETGSFDEEDEIKERNWTDYWRMLFKPITEEDIVNYEKDYIGSETELKDLKKAYIEGKGDMDYITDHVPFARCEHEPRLIKILKKMIADEEIPDYKIFSNEPEKKRKRRHGKQIREAKEVEEMNKQKGQENSLNDLALMIRQKQQDREASLDGFIDGLAAKYGGKTGGGKAKRKTTDAPTKAKKRKTRN